MGFIRTIGNCALNGYSFDVYENKNGSATIRPVKSMSDFPRPQWMTFKDLDSLENWVENRCGDVVGAGRVQILKGIFLGGGCE